MKIILLLFLVLTQVLRAAEPFPRPQYEIDRPKVPNFFTDDAPPVLFVTEENLTRLKSNLARNKEPWTTAWNHLNKIADCATSGTTTPYRGDDEVALRFAGLDDFIAASSLAIRWRITGDNQDAERARQILMAWADQTPLIGTTVPIKEPHDGKPWGNEPDIGLNFSYLATGFANAYSILYPYLSKADRAASEQWLRYLGERVKEGHQVWFDRNYYSQQYYNNHLSVHNMAFAAIGFALRDQDYIEEAFAAGEADYFDMVTGTILLPEKDNTQFWRNDPGDKTLPGEIYDRYRILTIRDGQGYGIGYSFMHLKLLLLTAEMAYNNGWDIFDFQGPHGESLEIAFEHLAPYLVTMDPSHYGDYHANDFVTEESRAYYEIARQRIGDNPAFLDALSSGSRIQKEHTILGLLPLLMWGEEFRGSEILDQGPRAAR